MTTTSLKQLELWLHERLTPENWQWLRSRLTIAEKPIELRELHISLGLVPRKLGRADLDLDATEIMALQRTSNQHWDVSGWTVETAARLLILCTVAQQNETRFGSLFTDLCRTADLNESITLYRGISLYPKSIELDRQIGEGLRTNIRAVFEAIAHGNSYPRDHFDQNRWNHMVLKALFIDSTLAPILGLDERANAELARILCDYAHERWAAKRQVTPELWRCVGPFATGDMIGDLQAVSTSSVEHERHAALLALSECPDISAHDLLKKFPVEAGAIERAELNWNSLSISMGLLPGSTRLDQEKS